LVPFPFAEKNHAPAAATIAIAASRTKPEITVLSPGVLLNGAAAARWEDDSRKFAFRFFIRNPTKIQTPK